MPMITKPGWKGILARSSAEWENRIFVSLGETDRQTAHKKLLG
jgi:hypothetical protein